MIVSTIFGQTRNAVSDREKSLLTFLSGKIATETSVIYELKKGENAFLSPEANHFSVLTKAEPGFQGKRKARVFSRDGSMLYQITETSADRVYIADSGAAVLITMLGIDPNSNACVEIYDKTGKKTGFAITPFPGECKFSPDRNTFSISLKGESTRIFNIESGEEEHRISYARTHIPLKNNNILLVDRKWFALFRGNEEIWRHAIDLYYPRLVTTNKDYSKVLIGCHHEIALLDIDMEKIVSRWEAPATFGVISIDASKDFTTIAVGVRSLRGIEAAYLLDKNFELIKKQERQVSKPTNIFPQVVILEKPQFKVLVFGQSWEKTLKR